VVPPVQYTIDNHHPGNADLVKFDTIRPNRRQPNFISIPGAAS
jgi:hypothetical protein